MLPGGVSALLRLKPILTMAASLDITLYFTYISLRLLLLNTKKINQYYDMSDMS